MVVFLLWVYVSSVILMYGVEFTAAYARLRRRRPDEMPAAPSPTRMKLSSAVCGHGDAVRVCSVHLGIRGARSRWCRLRRRSTSARRPTPRSARRCRSSRDAETTAYIRAIGDTTSARAASGPKYPYTFSVANYREINAFALPGGPIWIHRGVLARGDERIAGRGRPGP